MTAAAAPGKLLLFVTPPHQCSYLRDESATTAFVDPSYPKDPWLYSMLSRLGFRRSGEHVYRPACHDCHECVPLRLPVREFRPRRSQRRTWRANRDLTVVERDDRFRDEHFDLYRRYLAHRHPGGGMDNPTPRAYLEFLTSSWAETVFCEFRYRNELLAVSVTDCLPDALSAVYAFFAPEHERRGLGSYAILRQIELARRRDLEWLYLGYWIEACAKMSYKQHYLPQERLVDGAWVRVD